MKTHIIMVNSYLHMIYIVLSCTSVLYKFGIMLKLKATCPVCITLRWPHPHYKNEFLSLEIIVAVKW